MRKHMVLTSIGLASLVLITGCAQNPVDQQAQPQTGGGSQAVQQISKQSGSGQSQGSKVIQITPAQIIKMQQTIDAQNKQLKDLTDEVTYYRSYVKDFTATFNQAQMTAYINKEWSYSLSVNNVEVPKNGQLQVSEKSFNLVLNEQRVKYSVLPDELSQRGRVQDLKTSVWFDPSTVTYSENDNIGNNPGDTNSTITYSFKNVPSGTTINFHVSDDLKAKLKLNTNNLQISVN